jgi:hypothetical protein
LVVEITQRRRGYYDTERQKEQDGLESGWDPPDFIFRGGCTLLIDLESGDVRYCVFKRIGPEGEDRMDRQRRSLSEHVHTSLQASYFGDSRRAYYRGIAQASAQNQPLRVEPFALLHRSHECEEVWK